MQRGRGGLLVATLFLAFAAFVGHATAQENLRPTFECEMRFKKLSQEHQYNPNTVPQPPPTMAKDRKVCTEFLDAYDEKLRRERDLLEAARKANERPLTWPQRNAQAFSELTGFSPQESYSWLSTIQTTTVWVVILSVLFGLGWLWRRATAALRRQRVDKTKP